MENGTIWENREGNGEKDMMQERKQDRRESEKSRINGKREARKQSQGRGKNQAKGEIHGAGKISRKKEENTAKTKSTRLKPTKVGAAKAGATKPEEKQKNQAESAEKKKSFCPVSRKCGGCQLLDIPYSRQLRDKQKRVEELLKGFCHVYPIVGMDNLFHYRNKVHAAFGYRKGEVVSGVYQEGTHEIVPVEMCMLEDEKADQIIGTIRGMLKSFKIRTYDEETGYGFLRHVLVKRGFATGQVMVVLVTTSPIFPSKNNFVKALREKHPEITTIIQNLNDRFTSMVLGDKEKVLYGKGYIEDQLCGLTFRISSKSFYQVNPVQTEKLYARAIDAAGLTGKETVIDAYCGIGTIGIIAAQKAKTVIGVELNPDAVRDGVQNARSNKIDNIQFYNNDAGRFMTSMAQDGGHADVVFMDPPRSGSTEEFIEAVAKLAPSRVVYVSCNPETLARDLKVFEKKGFKAAGAWPYDLFPHTGHVETVVLMSRVEE